MTFPLPFERSCRTIAPFSRATSSVGVTTVVVVDVHRDLRNGVPQSGSRRGRRRRPRCGRERWRPSAAAASRPSLDLRADRPVGRIPQEIDEPVAGGSGLDGNRPRHERTRAVRLRRRLGHHSVPPSSMPCLVCRTVARCCRSETEGTPRRGGAGHHRATRGTQRRVGARPPRYVAPSRSRGEWMSEIAGDTGLQSDALEDLVFLRVTIDDGSVLSVSPTSATTCSRSGPDWVTTRPTGRRWG